MWLNTSRTTLWINSSVTCMAWLLSVCRKDHLIFDVHAIDDADDGGIDRQFIRFGRQAGTRSLNDQDHLALAGSNRINHDERAPGCHEPVALCRIHAHGFHSQ